MVSVSSSLRITFALAGRSSFPLADVTSAVVLGPALISVLSNSYSPFAFSLNSAFPPTVPLAVSNLSNSDLRSALALPLF